MPRAFPGGFLSLVNIQTIFLNCTSPSMERGSMEILRLRNDCVAQFFAFAIARISGGSISRCEMFEKISDIMSENWRRTGELPTVTSNEAKKIFSESVQDVDLSLALNIVMFREIPLGLFEDFASGMLSLGRVLGVGYRARYIFGGEKDDLHVSEVKDLSPMGYRLNDLDLAGEGIVEAYLLEQAVVSADNGFWIVNRN